MTRHRRRRPPDVESILRLVDRADLTDDPTVQRLAGVAAATDSPALERRIKQLLGIKAVQQQVQPFSDPAPHPQWTDRLELGVTVTGSRYDLAEDDLTQHLLAVGRSGAGKTTLFYNLMAQLSVPFWSFDLKQDYRHLVQTEIDVLVLPWPELKLNPLQPPPGVPPRRWAQVFTEIFGHATALLSGSKNYLLRQVLDLYRLYDLFTEVAPPYPSLHELQVLLERDKLNYVRKAANYRDTVLNRVAAMTLAAGTVFDCSEGYPLADLLTRNVVFEFDGLATDVQNLLMELLFAAVYEYRVAHTQRDGGLRHVFFLDEGKRVFSVYKEQQPAAGLPAIDELTAKLREFGEGLVVADQEATKLTDTLKANTYTKLLLATGDATQLQELAAAMNLSERQADLAHRLGIGEAVIQTGGQRPALVQLDTYDVAKTMSDAALRRAQGGAWNQLTATPRATTQAFDDYLSQSGGKDETDTIPDDPAPGYDLSRDADRLLEDVVTHPFTPVSERYDQFSSAYTGNKAKTALVDAGLVIERRVKAGEAKRKLLELTEQGREYAEAELDLDIAHRGRGGIVHRYWQHRLKDLFEAAGWPAKLELFDADVYVHLADTELVIEVAMEDTEREVEHVAQHLDTGFDVIWVVCRDEAVSDGLRERLAENDALDERVTFRLFRDLSGDELPAI